MVGYGWLLRLFKTHYGWLLYGYEIPMVVLWLSKKSLWLVKLWLHDGYKNNLNTEIFDRK